MEVKETAHEAHAVDHHDHGHHDHHHKESFISKYIFSMDHKMISKQFLLTGIIMGILGMTMSMLFRLQLAWPDATIHVVQVGHKMSDREIGRAIHHVSPYKFDKPVKDKDVPPFPSAPTYDAKGWSVMKNYHNIYGQSHDVLYWNVAG